MLGSLLGPYRIVSELGSGGMGTVYLAKAERKTADLAVDAPLALKVVHPHLLGRGGFFKRFLREGRVGQRLRHDNVVSTYDMDVAGGANGTVLYLAMEYVEGLTLRALLEQLGSVPEGLLRELARQIAAGLGAIHEAGIVHRDLKPENVMVTKDHEVRIMDLGVARLIEETDSLTEEGQFAGSLLYASPEQFGNQDVGPAADLYALGGMLYELATGDNPFRRDDAGAVIRAHLEEVPARVSDRNPEVSEFLAEIIATLLAKRPIDRLPSAAFLANLLAAGESTSWWSARDVALPSAAHRRPRVPVRRETALHGRATELTFLRAAWERARQGEGHTVWIEGEAGIGKTRLVDTFLDSLADEDIHVLYGSYPPSGGMGGLSEAILEHFGPAHLEQALAPYLEQAPALAPAFAAIVKHEPPPSGAEPVLGDALHALTVYLMRGLAAEKPLVWVVDDLHFAGPDSRKVMLSLARAVEGHPVLLVGTSRPGLPDEEVAHFSRLGSLRRLPLGRLSPRQVIELLQDAFHSEMLAERLGGKIAYKSDGVPFFVFEMIRGLKEGQFLQQRPDGSYVTTRVVDEIEVPSAVRDLVEGRLSHLTVEERAIVDVGAVQGYEFDAGLVADVLERKPIPVLQSLAQLERRSGLVRASGRLTRFDHHQVQEVLYQGLPEALRVEYHAALADACAAREAAGPAVARPAPAETTVFLATHFLRGSRPAPALAHLDAALDHLGASYRNEALLDLVDRALAVPGLVEGERRARLLLRQAGSLAYLGLHDAEGAALDDARVLLESGEDAALLSETHMSMGWRLIRLARYEEAEDRFRKARDEARGAGRRSAEAEAMRNLGITLFHRGRYDQAQDHMARALALAVEAADRRVESLATGSLGIVLRARGHYEEARAHHERHLEMARAIGDRRGVMNALGNLANILNYQGRFAEAREVYEDALEVAREIGDRYGEAAVTGSLGGLVWVQGRGEDALRLYESTLLLDREIGNREGEARILINLGNYWLHVGDYAEAQGSLERALALCREMGARLLEGHARLGLGECARETGRLEEAREQLEAAVEVFRGIQQPDAIATALRHVADLRAAGGDADGARPCWEEADRQTADATGSSGRALALARRAARGEIGAEAAVAAFEDRGERLSALVRTEILFRLWQATGDATRLQASWRLLCELQGHVPAEHREAMIERVALYREIRDAWTARS